LNSPTRRRTRWRRGSFSTGGTGPYTYALTAGTLPQGLSLTGSTISGTPQFQTIKTFTITSTDSLGNTSWQTYELRIDGHIAP
jgi:hypothetical protein